MSVNNSSLTYLNLSKSQRVRVIQYLMLEDDYTQDIYRHGLVGQILTISKWVVTLRGDDPVLQLSSVCSFSVSDSLWSVLLHGIKILGEKNSNFLNHIFYNLQLSCSQSCEVTARIWVLDSGFVLN